MGLFGFIHKIDFHQELENYRKETGAVLLDVRTPEEYKSGRVPGSRNLPLQQIADIQKRIYNKATPLYIYCHSGARSRQAVAAVRQMGYTNVRDMGGIIQYGGRIER